MRSDKSFSFSQAWFLVPLLLLATVSAAEPPSQTSFDRDAWMADYSFLKEELQASYSHLAWFASRQGGVDLPELDQKTVKALRRSSSNDEARAAIMSFVSGFHDGHFAATEVTIAQEKRTEDEPPIPANFANADTACAAFGYAPVNRVQFSLPFESLVGFELNSDGLVDAFRSGTINMSGQRIGIVRIAHFRAADFASLCTRAWKELKERGERPTVDSVRDEVNGVWLRVLAQRLKRFGEQGVSAVVVDIGGNGGGNDLGDWAVRVFTDSVVRSAPLLVSAGPAGVPYLDEQIGQLTGTLLDNADLSSNTRQLLGAAIEAFKRRKHIASQAQCGMSWVWQKQQDWTKPRCTRLVDAGFASGQYDYVAPSTFDSRVEGALYWASAADANRGAWKGKTFVLMDGKTGSAAEMFAALMRDRGVAKTIGAHTFGLGCGFMGDRNPVVLPHSQLAFSVPNCVRLRADGTDEVAGIQPDLPISVLPGESSRGRALRAINSIVRSSRGK